MPVVASITSLSHPLYVSPYLCPSLPSPHHCITSPLWNSTISRAHIRKEIITFPCYKQTPGSSLCIRKLGDSQIFSLVVARTFLLVIIRMCAKLVGERNLGARGRARGRARTLQCCEVEEAEADAEREAEVVAVAPPNRGVIAPGLLCACADCRVCWGRSDVPLPICRARGSSSRRVEECGRIISPGLLCACADCGGVGWKRSEGEVRPIRGGSLRRPEEECLRRRSMRWRFWRRTSSREVIQSSEMGTLWDVVDAGVGDPSGCGIQRVVESVFSRNRVHDEEEKHRCILHFPSMREFFTHEEVEHALVQLGWRPLTKRGGWRRYFKIEEPTLPYGLPTIAKLPGRSFVDAPKPILIDFVKTVNKRENRNIFCCWEHRGELLVSAGDRSILN